jgi:hypothetical protein
VSVHQCNADYREELERWERAYERETQAGAGALAASRAATSVQRSAEPSQQQAQQQQLRAAGAGAPAVPPANRSTAAAGWPGQAAAAAGPAGQRGRGEPAGSTSCGSDQAAGWAPAPAEGPAAGSGAPRCAALCVVRAAPARPGTKPNACWEPQPGTAPRLLGDIPGGRKNGTLHTQSDVPAAPAGAWGASVPLSYGNLSSLGKKRRLQGDGALPASPFQCAGL